MSYDNTLAPCPWCGTADNVCFDDTRGCVKCTKCQMEGPFGEDGYAQKRWNLLVRHREPNGGRPKFSMSDRAIIISSFCRSTIINKGDSISSWANDINLIIDELERGTPQ